MSESNLTAVADSKPITIEIASTEERCNELQKLLSDAVGAICSSGEKSVRSFMLIVDLISNEKFDGDQRDMVAEHVQDVAFAYSREASKAREQFLNTLNPGRLLRPRKGVRRG